MIWFYRIFRAVCLTVIVLLIVVPMLIYVLLTLPPVQTAMCSRAERELSALLQTPVSIESLSVAPFNRVTLRGAVVIGSDNDTIMKVRKIGAGMNIGSLFHGDRIVIDYAELTGLELLLEKDSVNGPLNIDPIIKKLSKKDDRSKATSFDLAVNTLVIRRSSVYYDVISEPALEGRFDKNHVGVTDFRADISLPKLKNDDFMVSVNRIAFNERSGLAVDDIHGNFVISTKNLAIQGLSVKLPSTLISVGDMSLPINGWKDIKTALVRENMKFEIETGSYITPSDLSSFVPVFENFDDVMAVSAEINGSLTDLTIDYIDIKDTNRKISLLASGRAEHLKNIDSLDVELPVLSFTSSGSDVSYILKHVFNVSEKVSRPVENAGHIVFNGSVRGNLKNADVRSVLSTDLGRVGVDLKYSRLYKTAPINISGQINSQEFDLANLTENGNFGNIGFDISGNVSLAGKNTKGNLDAQIKDFVFRNYKYDVASLVASLDSERLIASLNMDDSNGCIDVDLEAMVRDLNASASVDVKINDVDMNAMNLISGYDSYLLSADIRGDYSGWNPDTSRMVLDIENLQFISSDDSPSLTMKNMMIRALGGSSPAEISVKSDFIDANLKGTYSFSTIVPAVKEILARSFPVYFNRSTCIVPLSDRRDNNFLVHAEIKYNDELNRFLHLPVNVIYPVTIDAMVDYPARAMSVSVDAPYLQQKDKLIEETMLSFSTDTLKSAADLFATTKVPTKNGGMVLELNCSGSDNRLDSELSWKIDRKRVYKGSVDISTLFARDEEQNQVFDITINPSELVFNDTIWNIKGARIRAGKENVEVKNFDVRRDNQFVMVNGTVSAYPEDVLTLNLLNINLDYIFESLGIDKVMLGGDATGKFYVSEVFSKEPKMLTPELKVKGISYNKVVFGDAIIKSYWDNETKGIKLDALIDQPNGEHSTITGAIYPMSESLDLDFNAKKINVAFLKPYMEAFTSDVSGLASGHARLFGTFKYIDLEGDVFAEDLKLKLDFTNTVYSCTDSVKMRPGRIDIKNVELHDIYGNTAVLNGIVTHKFFKEPTFDFAITNARNFLSYDVNSSLNPDWYGRIFGNGSAYVKGEPGVVNISVDMSTGAMSTFTLVLSDLEEASEYSFITFRDRDIVANEDSINALDTTPLLIKRLRERMNQGDDSTPSVYNMNFQIGVTPDATLYLVMDPIGGDRIKANGSGNIRMEYNSANEDLRMYGAYTLERGSYNFTLQNIIIKDFTIKPGSTISFQGDPYAAQLNIKAVYQLNANLSDLDESFLQDKELNRTNVPVHALLLVNGDIRQPDISFDLEFPTLTNDTYRKVKSIVSTEDMMNRQIIYLLALNRFYTPDYMGATTKGNELVSVASSTISSQLSSMLGQLSENWSIAPNFRSDRGDFSDVEVDLALSSNLLNNRLLFNGNFGYRDKSMNTNQFIGDFDLEYLLNKRGSVRLKAYNRYNDQNYYVKTATTTQGIGIVFKRDFDNIFSFMHRLREKYKRDKERQNQSSPEPQSVDSISVSDDRKDFILIKSKDQ